ncbi:ribonuclease H-like domain-containing protein [Tanacetum coccineum]
MLDEYNALITNGTWVLVPRPANVNVVRSMWLFKHKFHADGSLSRYKARLVANGRSQQQGIDCDETFSPVVKPATIRTVLSLAVSRDWPIHQLDVKNAFLHGHLSETVYMHQPPGFVDPAHPDYVCHLQRSLYGLKQVSRAWFQHFVSYATRVGFQHSKTDFSLFVFHRGSDIAYLLLYVDDIILTSSSLAFLQRIIASLHNEFTIKHLEEILERAHMENCNPCRTPVDTESKLGSDGDPVSDPTLYHILAGTLQYLIFTRPDLSYAVQQVCLYMHDPRDPYFTALKRILCYVRGTLDYGLQLHVSSTTQLSAYTDADWAGCPVTRQSTSGYCVFLGDNLLSWSAKRQVTLSRSSAEVEYRGVANVVDETAWIRNLLCELHTPLFTATLVYCDNVSAVYMSTNSVQHQRTKHIEIDIHFVRDFVASGQVRVLHVPSRFYDFLLAIPMPSEAVLEHVVMLVVFPYHHVSIGSQLPEMWPILPLGILLRPLYEKTNAHGDKRLKPSDYELVRKIKEQVQNLPDLEIPPENAYIILETDGCMEGWGGIVKWKKSKEDPRSSERICAYASGKFLTTQSTIDAEINACINTLEKLKIYYLDKQEVTLRTDCQAIISFYKKTNRNKSSRVRWIKMHMRNEGISSNSSLLSGGSSTVPQCLLEEYEDYLRRIAQDLELSAAKEAVKAMRNLQAIIQCKAQICFVQSTKDNHWSDQREDVRIQNKEARRILIELEALAQRLGCNNI